MTSTQTITELPFNLPGRIYRSPMPFSPYDPEGELIAAYHRNEVSTIVLLTPEVECRRLTGKELRPLYAQEGFKVIYLPTPDMQAPSHNDLVRCLTMALDCAHSGGNLVIHCYAGVGRTGTFAACLAKRILGLNGDQAIAWVRQFIPMAVETKGQRQFVIDMLDGGATG